MFRRLWPCRHFRPGRRAVRGPPRLPATAAPRPQADARRHYSGCACRGASRKTTAYIALGSNLGDRVAEIETACREMDRRGIKVRRTSSLWETEPMYVTAQDRFINGACEVGGPVRAHPADA